MRHDNTSELHVAERAAKRFWASLVILLLGLQLAIGTVAIRIATGDQTDAIVPDYHNAALDWDQCKAELARFDALGWDLQIQSVNTFQVTTLQSSDNAARGHRPLIVSLRGANRDPIENEPMVIKAFHHARSDQVFHMAPACIGDGTYEAILPSSRKGVWEFEITVDVDGKTARDIRTMELD